jgi:hypothetical protein
VSAHFFLLKFRVKESRISPAVSIASVSAHFFLLFQVHVVVIAGARSLNRLGVGALLLTCAMAAVEMTIAETSQSPRCRRTSSYPAYFYPFLFNCLAGVFDRPPGQALQNGFSGQFSRSKSLFISFIFIHMHNSDRPHCLTGNPRLDPHGYRRKT